MEDEFQLITIYIIQVEDRTVLETPGPTYSFDIMYSQSVGRRSM